MNTEGARLPSGLRQPVIARQNRSSAMNEHHLRALASYGAIIAAVAFALVLQGRAAVAAPGDIGYQDQSYGAAVGTPTGSKRNESLLWFNDGSWWAHMWEPVSQDYHIFRLDRAIQMWADTGTLTDGRITTHGDTLWDGQHLYIASHVFVNDEDPAVDGFPSRLYRYSYNPSTDTYTLDAGFPSLINNVKTETLVIDKDSTGKLWATWQQGNQIYVNATQGDDLSWGTPFVIPTAGATVTVDDTSSIVAFGGNKIGVMWSSQTLDEDGMWFAVHVDGQLDSIWEASTRAVEGLRSADDHMNLKALPDGRVLAAVKSEQITFGQPLISLLERTRGGTWNDYTVGIVQDCHNRPSVLVDTEAGVIHVLATGPAPGSTCNSTGGAIYEKTSPLNAISFAPGLGTPVILDADNPTMHNMTSTKQNVTSATGLVGLAINSGTDTYWHHFDLLGGVPSAPDADFSADQTTGTAPLTVAFTDTSTWSPTAWSWDFGDGSPLAAVENPTHQYTQAGTFTVRLTAANGAGPDTEQKVGYIHVDAPATSPSPPEFTDAKSSIFRADIAWARAEDITTGCAVDRYCPNAMVTRAQMASFLARALDLPATSQDFFTDDETSIHEADINRLAAAGITSGCAAHRYCPGVNVTRQEMASFLVRAFHFPGTTRDFFTDDESSIHESDINRLAAAGVTTGCAPGRFCPRDPVSRGQMAAFLHRAMT
jgi:PKD repeat protein